MSLWKTDTPDYAIQAENPAPWRWLQSLLGPAAVHYARQAATTADTSVPGQLREWLRALMRTKTPAYHPGKPCDVPGKSPDEPGKQ